MRDLLDRGAVRVLDSLPTWGHDECIENSMWEGDWLSGNADRLVAQHLKNGDTSDLRWSGYGMGDDGNLWRERCGDCYLDIEYAPRPLETRDQWAEVVSAYLKRELPFEEAVNLLRYLAAKVEYETRHDEADRQYPTKFYPNGAWQMIR